MEIEPEFGFRPSIREVDLLRSRIAELEDQIEQAYMDGFCKGRSCESSMLAGSAAFKKWIKGRE